MENNNETNIGGTQNTPQNVELSSLNVMDVVSNKKIRVLKPGTPEFQAALNEEFGQKEKTSKDSAPLEQEDQDEETKQGDSETESEESEDEDEQPAKGEKRSKERHKIDKLVKKNSKLEEKVNQLERMLNEGLRHDQPPEKKTESTKKESKGNANKAPPKASDYEDPDDYQVDLAQWTYERNKAHQDKQANASKAKTDMESKFNDFTSKTQKFAETEGIDADDMDEILEEVKLYDVAKIALFESDYSAEIAHHIGSHKELSDKFQKLSPPQQVKELGKLEGLFEAKKPKVEKKEEPKKITSAKKPGGNLPKSGRVEGTGGAMPDPKTNYQAWLAWRSKNKKV